MKKRLLLVVLATASIGVSISVPADEIYKWTDADGYVHYEDRPAPDAAVERIRLSYNRTDNEAVQERVQARRDAQSQRQKSQETSAAAAEDVAEKQERAETTAKRCKQYRDQLNVMALAAPVYREDENGDRVYLDDAQRDQARAKTERLISEYCSS